MITHGVSACPLKRATHSDRGATWAVSPGGVLELRDDPGALQVSYAAAMG